MVELNVAMARLSNLELPVLATSASAYCVQVRQLSTLPKAYR